MRVNIYQSEDGHSPFSDWMDKLKDSSARTIILARLERIRRDNFGNCKSVGGGVYELKIYYKQGYRVYFGRVGMELVILLCGGTKSSQTKDISKAKNYWRKHKHAKR